MPKIDHSMGSFPLNWPLASLFLRTLETNWTCIEPDEDSEKDILTILFWYVTHPFSQE